MTLFLSGSPSIRPRSQVPPLRPISNSISQGVYYMPPIHRHQDILDLSAWKNILAERRLQQSWGGQPSTILRMKLGPERTWAPLKPRFQINDIKSFRSRSSGPEPNPKKASRRPRVVRCWGSDPSGRFSGMVGGSRGAIWTWFPVGG